MPNFSFYTVHGLNIKSSISFPELLKSEKRDSDVLLRYSRQDLPSKGIVEESSGILKLFRLSKKDICFFIENEPLFRVKNGNEIIVNPNTSIDNVYLRSLILGRGLGTLLHQKDYLVLHASALNIKGRTIAFLGLNGDGKSTITAALNKKGYPLMSDDVLAVKLNKNNQPIVFPSFPSIKLWEDVIEYISDKTHQFSRVHPEFQKYTYKVNDLFSVEPLPLERIYVLVKDEKNEIIPLESKEGLIELIKNSYNLQFFDDNDRSQNLFQCANLLKYITIKRLKRSMSLKELNNLIQIVEEDIN